jgi:BlaI family penicillinase repressor
MLRARVRWLRPGSATCRLTHYYQGSITSVVKPIHTVSKPKIHRLGDLQLKIMQVLWERREATVAEVHQALNTETELAYTTMATMLRKMEARGLVKHRSEGRSFVYRAAVAADAVTRGMADHLVDRFFEGSLTDVVSHLLTTREVSRDELTQLERLIAERKKSV